MKNFLPPIDENIKFLSNSLRDDTIKQSKSHYKFLTMSIQTLHFKTFSYSLIALLIASGFIPVKTVSAQNTVLELSPAIEHHAEGQINWTSGTLSATGFGAPPPLTTPAAAQAMASRAAIAVARRNLLELVEGVRIDSKTLVENFMVKSDIIQSHVQGLVKNAFIAQKHVLADGNVEVRLSMNMWGNDSLMSNLIPETANFSQAPEDAGHDETYTGIMIDTRELGVRPATFPTVTDEEGRILYEKKTAPHDLVREMGTVQYFVHANQSSAIISTNHVFSVSDKPSQLTPEKRVGPRPLHIKGIQKLGSLGTDIMVSAADAKKIRQDPTLMNLLRKTNVIIVIDPLVAGVEGRLKPWNMLPVDFSYPVRPMP